MSDDTDDGEKRPHVRLGAKIREARRRVGYTQSALAKMLDVTRASVAQWETGRSAPGRKRRVRLAAVLKSLLADLPGAAVAPLTERVGRPSTSLSGPERGLGLCRIRCRSARRATRRGHQHRSGARGAPPERGRRGPRGAALARTTITR